MGKVTKKVNKVDKEKKVKKDKVLNESQVTFQKRKDYYKLLATKKPAKYIAKMYKNLQGALVTEGFSKVEATQIVSNMNLI